MSSFPVEEWEANAAEISRRFYGSGQSPMAKNGMAVLDAELADLVQIIARGRSYADPTVDLKTRALCTVACLVGLGHQRYIETWIANAITAGATVEEVSSLLSQLFVYVGTPKAVRAFDALQAVIGRLEAS
jgi:alkylhydroperoxidase/carboxymuconolactone decarboxylase family protein YurZ